MVNKVLREKSNGLVWWSSKSRFKKTTTQQQNIIEQHFKSSQKDVFFKITKTYIFIVKNVKNTQVTRFKKNWSWFLGLRSKENENVLFVWLK